MMRFVKEFEHAHVPTTIEMGVSCCRTRMDHDHPKDSARSKMENSDLKPKGNEDESGKERSSDSFMNRCTYS